MPALCSSSKHRKLYKKVFGHIWHGPVSSWHCKTGSGQGWCCDAGCHAPSEQLRSWETCADGPALTDSAVMSPCVKSKFPNQLCRYGYVTNSKVKFVMVVDSSNTALRDNEIRSVSVGTSDLIFPVSLEMLRSPQRGSSCASM